MRVLFLLAAVFLFASPSCGQVVVRVVDVGAGLCCVIKTPDDKYMIYDAGNYVDRGYTAMVAIENMIPVGSEIELMVLSHCDADHLAAVPFICENYVVKEVWRDGFDPGTATYRFADEAIDDEVADDGCNDINLQEVDLEPGFEFELGLGTTVTFLCGFADIPSSWGFSTGSGKNKNARSIVVRLDHGDSSILFGGDTVGRYTNDPWDYIFAAEKFLVDNASNVSLDVDVVIAPHHGAGNGSSWPFILAMSPEYVIFSAGSKHHHPHYFTANRYLWSGVNQNNILRTDRGDNEGSPEWYVHGGNSRDPRGDDDIEVVLHSSGLIEADYVSVESDVQPFAEALRTVSPRVQKYLDADEMWTETHDDLEDHTHDDTRPGTLATPESHLAGSPPIAHQTHSGGHYFHRGGCWCSCCQVRPIVIQRRSWCRPIFRRWCR